MKIRSRVTKCSPLNAVSHSTVVTLAQLFVLETERKQTPDKSSKVRQKCYLGCWLKPSSELYFPPLISSMFLFQTLRWTNKTWDFCSRSVMFKPMRSSHFLLCKSTLELVHMFSHWKYSCNIVDHLLVIKHSTGLTSLAESKEVI